MSTEVIDAQSDKSIIIPVRESDQVVEIFVDELNRDDSSDIIDMLRGEIAPLAVWLRFAIEYHKQGHVDLFFEFLNNVLDPSTEEMFTDEASEQSRLHIYNALAGHHIAKIWNAKDEDREKERENAISYFKRADRINPNFIGTLIGKGTMFLSQSDPRAERFLTSALKTDEENIAALLGQALFLFRKGAFEKARDNYMQAIKRQPGLDVPHASQMRMCFGYCCYKMGAFKKAEAAMERASLVNPKNVEAIIGSALALLRRMSPSEKERCFVEDSEFFFMISRAHRLDPTNQAAMVHMSNICFRKWGPPLGAVEVTQNSKTLKTPMDYSAKLKPGNMILIESPAKSTIMYISTEANAVTPMEIKLDSGYPYAATDSEVIRCKDLNQSTQLALNALRTSQSDRIKAESCYLLGRQRQVERAWNDALAYYIKAEQLWPEYVLPLYGLAQMYFEKRDFKETRKFLSKALRAHPDNLDVLMFLAFLTGLEEDLEQAVTYYRRIIELHPGHAMAFIGMGELLMFSKDEKDQAEAIRAFESGKLFLVEDGVIVPQELLVNLAVLHQNAGDIDSAIECYRRALESSSTTDDSTSTTAVATESESKAAEGAGGATSPSKASSKASASASDKDVCGLNEPVNVGSITILYNLALLYEKMGERAYAEQIHNNILKECPHYIECILRLGCIHRDCGESEEAMKYFEKAESLDPENVDAVALYANMFSKQGKYSIAQKHLESLLARQKGKSRKNDPYVLLSLGNIYCDNLSESTARNLALCQNYYHKVLSADKSNLYAANGIGICLAEAGNISAAKQVFSQVREAAPDLPDAWVNLAHIHMAEKRYAEAIQLYQMCLSQCYNNRDTEVMMYLAMAFYEDKKYDRCIRTLTKLLVISPLDGRCWYNLALCQEEFAVMTLGNDSSRPTGVQRTVADVEKAMACLQRAEGIYTFLVSDPNVSSSGPMGFDKEKASEHAMYCADTLSKATFHLQYERTQEQKREAEAESQRKLMEAYSAKKIQQEIEKRTKEDEMLKKRQEVAQKKQARLQELSSTWKMQDAQVREASVKKKTPRTAKRKKDKAAAASGAESSDESSAPDYSEDEKPKSKRRKRIVTQEERNLFGSSSEEDDDDDLPPPPTNDDAKMDTSTVEEPKEPTTSIVEDGVGSSSKSTKQSNADLFGSDSSSDEE